MRHRTPTRSAFTLIELLAVIAIIGILAAIIIPVVGKVRQSARTATATSNLRQIGMAASTYASDSRTYPEGQRSGSPRTWDGLLAPYVTASASQWGGGGGSNSEVFVDPARGVTPAPTQNGEPVHALTFGANPNVFVDTAGSNAKPVSPSAVQRPSQTLLVATSVQKADGYTPELLRAEDGAVFDSNAANADQPIFASIRADGTEGGGYPNGYVSYRHSGRALTVMADGSVQGLKPGDLKRRHFRPNY